MLLLQFGDFQGFDSLTVAGLVGLGTILPKLTLEVLAPTGLLALTVLVLLVVLIRLNGLEERGCWLDRFVVAVRFEVMPTGVRDCTPNQIN